MNKKYLSALLFGAVLIASTGTFTSCKDYDDDIQGLQAQVDGLSANIQELQAAAGKYVTSVTYDENTGVLTVVGGTGGTYQLPMPAHVPEYTLEIVGDQVILKADGEEVSSANLPEVDMPDIPDAFDPELLSWGADGYLYYGDVKVEGVEKPDAPASITEILDGTEVIGYIIDINGDKAVFYVKSKLTSLVFAPDFYYQGIEAMQAATYNYTEKTLKKVDANGDYATDAPTVVGDASMTPGLVANYHMNPSNADWTKITELTYISEDKDYVRSAGPTVKANVFDYNGDEYSCIRFLGTHSKNDKEIKELQLQNEFLEKFNKLHKELVNFGIDYIKSAPYKKHLLDAFSNRKNNNIDEVLNSVKKSFFRLPIEERKSLRLQDLTKYALLETQEEKQNNTSEENKTQSENPKKYTIPSGIDKLNYLLKIIEEGGNLDDAYSQIANCG